MRFFDLSPGAALLLLAGVAAAVVVLYLLRPSPRRLSVSSALIWQRVLKQRKRRPERLRWWLSLLLALAIALSVAAALTRPELAAVSGAASDVVLVIDTFPTMAVLRSDGRTRLAAALERAERIIAERSAGSRYLVADTMHQIGEGAFEPPAAALARLRTIQPATAGTPWFPQVLFPDADGAAEADRRQLWFLTDGVAALQTPPGTRQVSAFEAADNVGITAFEVRAQPADPRQHQAYLEATNASAGAKKVQIRIAGVGAPAVARELDLAGGASASVVVDVSAFGEGPLRAGVRADADALPLDDVAYAYLPGKGKVRVGLVTSGNADLVRTLRLLPRVAVEVISPGALRDASRFDALILDRFVPSEPPRVPALLIGPRSVAWLARRAGTVTDTRLAHWDGSHPLLAGVSLRDVLVDRATLFKPGSGERAASLAVVAQGPGGEPLILAAREGRRLALVNFALEQSNFPLQASFPAFLSNAIDWLTREPRALAAQVGQVSVPAEHARVLDLDGREVATRAAPAATLFDATGPGLYTVLARDERMRVAVNLFDPRITAVNASRFARDAAPVASLPSAPPLTTDPWVLLLVLAALLLAAEWWAYSRRLTV
jgi:Aerotolerance regulator N-terminal